MAEEKPRKKIGQDDLMKPFEMLEQMQGGKGKVNVDAMREKINEHLAQFETPEFKERIQRVAEVGKQMKEEGWSKEKVQAMPPEERQAFGRQMMERMGLPIPDKLKKKIEKE